MAVLPVTLLNGTTADANDVMDDFDEIYDNITEVNVGVSNKTGSGKFVLQTSPTLLGLTVSNPVVTGSLTLNSGCDLKIYSDAATTLKFQVDGATGDFGMAAARRFYLDGASLGGDTYISETGANVVEIFIGGESALRGTVATRLLEVNDSHWSFAVPTTQKIYLDGGGDTYLSETSGNVVELFVGSESALRATRSTRLIEVNQSTWDFAIQTTRKLYLDGGGDTYLSETAGNTLGVIVGGNTELAITTASVTIPTNNLICSAGNISVGTDNKVLFDGSAGNTYITNTHPGLADVMEFFVDGALQGSFGGSFALSIEGSMSFNFATKDLTIQDSGTAAATEVAWVQVDVGGTPGFIRVYATK